MPKANGLLSNVEASVWADFAGRVTRLELQRGQVLQRPGEEIAYVYFPTSAVISVGAETVAGESVNVALIGPEGALGVFEACGSRQSYSRGVVQVAGYAWRFSAAHYRDLFGASDGLRGGVHRYVEVLLAEARQFVACNALHTVEARLCRSILEALERSCDGQTLPATQETLAQMLGVQRTTVTAAISALQAGGALRTARGQIEVLEPLELEDCACVCREALQAARAEIYAAADFSCDS
jgi:CRP-like cAMP-binding protein